MLISKLRLRAPASPTFELAASCSLPQVLSMWSRMPLLPLHDLRTIITDYNPSFRPRH